VLMHTPVGTLRTRALAMPKAHAASSLQSYGARNGTSHSARNSCLSDQSPAHENASRQAVYGPGVAAQINSFLTRALGIPKRTLGCLRTRKMLATHGTIDSARSSRDSGSPPTSHRSKRPWRVWHRPKMTRSCTYPRKRLVCMVWPLPAHTPEGVQGTLWLGVE